MKVIVTGAGAVLGQAIIKSLKKSSLKVKIIAVDPSPLAVGLYWADKHYIIPMAMDSNYIEKIYQILKKEKPDVLLVGTDVELLIFSKLKQEIEKRYKTKLLVRESRVIEIANDK